MEAACAGFLSLGMSPNRECFLSQPPPVFTVRCHAMKRDHLKFHRLGSLSKFTVFGWSCADLPAWCCLSQIVLLVVLIGSPSPNRLFAVEQAARLNNGQQQRGQLLGPTADKLRFRAAQQGAEIPLTDIKVIEFQASKQPATAQGPLKRIWLRGGESFNGEIVSWSESTVNIREEWSGEQIEIPTAAIAALEQLQGTVNLVYEDFETGQPVWVAEASGGRNDRHSRSGKFSLQLTPNSPPLVYDLATPLIAGSVQMNFFDRFPKQAAATWEVEFRFETQLGERVLRTVIGARPTDVVYQMQSPLGPRFNTQPLRRTAGWRRLEVQFDELHTMLLIDGNVLASGPAMKGILKSVRWSSTKHKSVAPQQLAQPPAGMWIDDFQITQFVSATPLQIPRRKQDVLLLATGDEVYGAIKSLDGEKVEFSGKFGTVTVPWRDLRGLLLRERPMTSPLVSGLIARISLHETSPVPSTAPHVLYAAIESVEEDKITLVHPVLGRRTWSLGMISKIEPLYRGSYSLLATEARHLGDEIRSDFRRPEPEGKRLEVIFPLDAPPAGDAYVSLFAAHLEPAGAQTLASPFLSELRRGHLGTTLFVNEKRIGLLNKLINFRAPVEKPERIRLRIPPGILKTGVNKLRIEQDPSAKDASDFDDCEISRIVLEVEAGEEMP